MSSVKPIRVLFLCTHNSARSILSEALLNHLGQGRFQAFSAGSAPREHQQPNPFGLLALQRAGIDVAGLSSKSWDVFASPDQAPMDLIVTVCDNAAAEVCPIWPGAPASAHWGYADPSAVMGDDAQKLAAFEDTLGLIRQRIEQFVALPDHALSPDCIQSSARALVS